MRQTLLAFWIALAYVPARAGTGTSSAEFLDIGLGPRAVAMGGSFSALADDVSAIYWNPAGLSQLIQQEAAFSHTQWLNAYNYEYLVYAHPHELFGALGAGYSSLSKSSIPGYDETGAPTGAVSVDNSVATLAWGKAVSDRLSLGIAAKWIQESLAGYSAAGYAADLGALGVLYQDIHRRVTAGLAVRNLGAHGAFVSADEPLPRSAVVGLGFKGFSERLNLDIEGVVPGAQEVYATAGGEYWVYPMLAFRAGYRSSADVGSGFSAGVGFRVNSFQFDYSFSDFGVLGFVNRGGISYRFGDRGGRYYEEGVKLMQAGNYAEAFLRFNKILAFKPGNRAAILRMKECRTHIQEELKETPQTPPSEKAQ